MKKIKYLSLIVLSLLFVGFSYGDDYSLSNAIFSNIISFEYPTVSKNIHYFLFNSNTTPVNASNKLLYGLTNNSLQAVNNFYQSYFNGNYLSFDTSYRGSMFTSVLSKTGFSKSNYNGFLVLKQNADYSTYYPNSINYLALFNGNSNSTLNGLVNFTNGTYPTMLGSSILASSYMRFFYSPQADTSLNFWSSTTSPGVADINDNPLYFQQFKPINPGFLTQNGNITIGSFGNLFGVSPALSMGFGFFKNYQSEISRNDLKFGTVFPFYDSYQTNGNYSLPSWAYTDDYYMFRINSLKYNSDAGYIGVIAKCTPGICGSGLYSNLIYSEYLCSLPGNGLSFNTSSHYINIKESCIFQRGGILKNALPFTNSTGSVDFQLSNSNYRDGYTTASPYGRSSYLSYFSFYFDSNTLKYCGYPYNDYYTILSYVSNCNFSLGTLDTTVSYDILGTFQNDNQGTGSINISGAISPEQQAINIICNMPQFGRNPICNEGIFDSSDSTDIIFDTDGSGNLYAVVTIYNTGDENCPDMYYTGDDGLRYHQYFDRVCYFAVEVDRVDSTPNLDSGHLTDGFWSYEDTISNYFYDIIDGSFKFYSCPFNSPLRALNLSSIGGLSSFLLDKFFDVNLVGPFNCLIGGALYSMTDGNDLASGLFPYDGPKYFTNFPNNVKKIINFGLVSLILMLFWKFRPNNHDE